MGHIPLNISVQDQHLLSMATTKRTRRWATEARWASSPTTVLDPGALLTQVAGVVAAPGVPLTEGAVPGSACVETKVSSPGKEKTSRWAASGASEERKWWWAPRPPLDRSMNIWIRLCVWAEAPPLP